MPHTFISWWLEISKSMRQCLQVRNSFFRIFRFHLGVTYDTCLSLSALIHLEWSSLFSFPWLNTALFPTSLLLRNIVLCMYPSVCIHSSVLLQIILFPVLAVAYSGAKSQDDQSLLKFWVSSPSFLDPIPVQIRDTARWGSRGGIAAEEREVARNRLGADFFPFFSSCQSSAGVESSVTLCLLSVLTDTHRMSVPL